MPEYTTSAPRLSSRFEEALVYASQLHATQVRKGTSGTPYVAHLLGVASLVLEDGGDEDQAIAALLHDAVEDFPEDGQTRKDIGDRFGERVQRIVLACTDSDPDAPTGAAKESWRSRKERYLRHLEHQPAEVLRVSVADKLYNATMILNEFRRIGPLVWNRFTAGRANQLWYYRSLVDVFRRAPSAPPQLVEQLDRMVSALERLDGKTEGRKDGK
ncbi:MAG: HD domain-containing protein [Gemmatimonadales bacterium]